MSEKISHVGCDVDRVLGNPQEFSYLLVYRSFIGSKRLKIHEIIGEYDQHDADVLAEIIRYLAGVSGSSLIRDETRILIETPHYSRADVFGKMFHRFYNCRELGQRLGMTRLEFVLAEMDPEFRNWINRTGSCVDFEPVPATHRQLEVAAALFRWLGSADGEHFLTLAEEMTREQVKLQAQLYRVNVHQDRMTLMAT